MAFDAKVYKVLIASPSDVGDERNIIPEIINEWNAVSAFQLKIILMPIKWESHSAPLLGNRPQAIINEQLVNDCDILVGVFWTRIGTHTGVSISGTAEEIEHFVEQEKPVMLYFSQSPVDPDKIDINQFTILRSFKEKMRLKGLTESYSGMPDFRQKFSRQLAINLNSIIANDMAKLEPNKIEPKDKSAARAAEKSPRSQEKTKVDSVSTEGNVVFPIEKLTKEKISEYLIKAANAVCDDEGWAHIAAIGIYLRTYTPVNYRSLGFDKLNKFLESSRLFEIKSEQKSSKARAADSTYVRLLRKS